MNDEQGLPSGANMMTVLLAMPANRVPDCVCLVKAFNRASSTFANLINIVVSFWRGS